MAVSTKMSVDISGFKTGMQEAAATVKTLDAELKRNEAQFKATGNAEQYLADKASLLQMKLNTQKVAVTNLEKALEKMRANGVNQTSVEYQRLQTQLSNAQTAMLNTSVELNELTTSEENASKGAQDLNQNISQIGRKLSLDQVISGINSITNVMEKAGKKAIELGKAIWNNIEDAGKMADDIATQAMRFDMGVEEYQAYKKVFDTIGEMSVEGWQSVKTKVQRALSDPNKDQQDIFSMLGISPKEWATVPGQSGPSLVPKNWEKMFWDIGQRLRQRVADGLMTQDQADVWAQALFGKGFAELKPLLNLGEEAFHAAVDEQLVASEDAINKLAEMNDTIGDLVGDFESLKLEVLSGLAPALTKAAEVLDQLLAKVLEYIKSEDGQRLMENLGKSIESFFTDISNIDPDKVAGTLTGIFDQVTGAFEWISEHWQDVVTGIKAIGLAFVGLKIAEGGLTIVKFMEGLKNLVGMNGSPTVDTSTSLPGTGTGTGTGSSGGWLTGLSNAMTAFMTKVVTTITTFDPSGVTALIPQVLSDYTVFGRTLRDGGSLSDAFGSIPGTLAASWEQAQKNWSDAAKQYMEGIKTFMGWEEKYLPDAFKDIGPHFDEEALQAEWEAIKQGMSEDETPVEVVPEVPEDAAAMITEQVGTVTIPVLLVPQNSLPGSFPGGGGGSPTSIVRGLTEDYHPKANGIWSVPYDGYLALLHRNERVTPAREVAASRNFSSNLYVESMIMNNGTDADGLAAAMAAAQRRTLAGFGS